MKIPDKRVFLLKRGRLAEKCYDLFKLIVDRLNAHEDQTVIVAVNISSGNATGSSAADAKLINADIIGIIPSGNQDQLVSNVEILEDGKVKVTLGTNATAQNQFKVAVKKALP